MISQAKFILRDILTQTRRLLPEVPRWVAHKTEPLASLASITGPSGFTVPHHKDELRVFFDLAICPVTFDIANFLALAEIARMELGCKHMRLFVVPAPGHGFRNLNIHSADHSRHRLLSIIAPAIQTLPSCTGISLLTDRKSAERLVPEDGAPIFPYRYSLDRPTRFYSWKNTWQKIDENKEVQSLRAPEHCKRQVEAWLARHGLRGKKIATITLREANYQRDRNNNIEEWAKFCVYLSNQGFQPLIVRDFDRTYDELPKGFDGIPTCDVANWDLGFRAALYEDSDIAFFVNNGPWVFGLFNAHVRFIATKVVTESVMVTSTGFRIDMGDQIGQNYRFLKEGQRVVWENDDYEVLVRNFEDHMLKSDSV